MIRRAYLIGLTFTIVIVIYLARLFVIQVTPVTMPGTSEYSKYKQHNWKRTAVSQRSKRLQLDDGRAVFFDQHRVPLHTERYTTAAFFPIKHWQEISIGEISELASILKRNAGELSTWLRSLETADFLYDEMELPIKLTEEQCLKLNRLHFEGLELVPYTARNGHHRDYLHVIGFLGEHPEWVEEHYKKEIEQLANWDRNKKIGASGLERSLDRVLHGVGPTYISYTLDGQSRYMSGIGPRVVRPENPYYPMHVITTLDEQLQASLERIIDERGIVEGAVVMLDAHNGDIKAMVSRPALVPGEWNDIEETSWKNHALTAYEPGSVYKIVTAAAALEYGVVTEDESFHCDGEYGKYGLSCWKKGGHGKQTLAEAFANSCNIVFATLAERLTPKQLHDTAASLGVIYPVGWHHDQATAPFSGPIRLLEEEEGGTSVLDQTRHDGGIMAQSGIGQRDVRLTPLQAANMLVTIINGGVQYETRVVSSIEYADGLTAVELPIHTGHEHRYRIHPSTARRLMTYMEGVTARGTASHLAKGAWPLAGKSGTAQLSGSLAGLNNQWFVGYAPANKPRYTAAVLVRKAKQGTSNQAALLFREVMEEAARHDQLEQQQGKKK